MDKPKIEDLVDYLKIQIPNCSISQPEVDDLKGLYPNISYKDLNRVFHQAIKQHCMQPLSYITRQLRVLRPSTDPFNSQINGKSQFYYGKSVEKGTDWDAVAQRLAEERQNKLFEYDQIHGQGAYEHKEAQEFKEVHQFFVDFEKKYMEK